MAKRKTGPRYPASLAAKSIKHGMSAGPKSVKPRNRGTHTRPSQGYVNPLTVGGVGSLPMPSAS